jgi:hypothetical protein
MILISHGLVESELRALAAGQSVRLWGREVLRLDEYNFSVDGSRPLLLLLAIDSVMSGFGSLETLD